MKKVKDTALEARIDGILASKSKTPAADIVALLKAAQDSSGLKVCQNVSPEDLAYKEV